MNCIFFPGHCGNLPATRKGCILQQKFSNRTELNFTQPLNPLPKTSMDWSSQDCGALLRTKLIKQCKYRIHLFWLSSLWILFLHILHIVVPNNLFCKVYFQSLKSRHLFFGNFRNGKPRVVCGFLIVFPNAFFAICRSGSFTCF